MATLYAEIPEVNRGNGSKWRLSDVPPNLGKPETQLGNDSPGETLFPINLPATLFEKAKAAAVQTLSELDSSIHAKNDQRTLYLGEFGWSPPGDPDESRFMELAAKWQYDTAASSSITEMAIHPSYQQIIGMGRNALPFIFRELEKAPHHWFWALRAITGEDPVKPEHRGNLDAMTKDWLEWAEK